MEKLLVTTSRTAESSKGSGTRFLSLPVTSPVGAWLIGILVAFGGSAAASDPPDLERGVSVLSASEEGAPAVPPGPARSARSTARGPRLLGSFLDKAGRPLAGARALLVPALDAREQAVRALAGEPPTPVAEATVDDEGWFELETPRSGSWSVILDAPGRVPLVLPPRLVVEDEGLEPAVALRRRALRLRVSDPAGRPVAGCRVTVLPLPGPVEHARRRTRSNLGRWTAGMRHAVTDPAGAARLEIAGAERLRVVVVPPVGSGLATATDLEVEAPAALAVTLTTGRPVPLRIVDPAGRPAAGTVALLGTPGVPVARADEAGRIELALARGAVVPLVLRGMAGDLALRLEGPPADASPVGSGRLGTQRQLRLEARQTVSGTVGTDADISGAGAFARGSSGSAADASSRRALPGAWVWHATDPAVAVRAGAGGRYRIDLPRLPGDRHLHATAGGYGIDRVVLDPGGGDPVRGPRLVLEPTVPFVGRVVDGAGRPVPSARVRAASPSGGFRRFQVARTGPGGVFHLGRLAAGAPVDLEAAKAGFGTWMGRLQSADPGRPGRSARIVLPPLQPAVGRIVGAGSMPLVGATVVFVTDEPLGIRNSTRRQTLLAVDRTDRLPRAVTGEDGVFRVTDLQPGHYRLVAWSLGHVMAVSDIRVERPTNGPFRLETVRLVPESVLSGSVVDPEGKPIPGAAVSGSTNDQPLADILRLVGGMSPSVETITDAAGLFRLHGVAAQEPTKLVVSAEGFRRRYLSPLVPSQADPLRVVLQPGVGLRGRVVDTSGRGLEGVSVNLGWLPVKDWAATVLPNLTRVWTDEDGRFEFEGLEPGWRLVTAKLRGYVPTGSPRFELRLGARQKALRLVLERGASLEGTVETPDGRAVEGVTLQLDGGALGYAEAPEAVLTDSAGRYRIEGLRVGEHTLHGEIRKVGFHGMVTTTELRFSGRPVRIAPGTNRLNLEAEVDEETRVSGWVTDPRGDPIAGAEIRRLDSVGPMQLARAVAMSEGDGSFSFKLPTGETYTLMAGAEGFGESESVEVAVGPEPIEGLALATRWGASIVGRVQGATPDQVDRLVVRAFRGGWFGSTREIGVSADGTFRFDGLVPGKWSVSFTQNGVHPQATRDVKEVVNIEELGDTVELVLRLKPVLKQSGRVTLEGSPLADAKVRFYALAGGKFKGSGTTNGEGEFQAELSEAGPSRVRVAHSLHGLWSAPDQVLDGTQSLDLAVSTKSIEGTVVTESDGKLVPGARIELFRLGPGGGEEWRAFRTTRSDSSGEFRWEDLFEGTYRVRVKASGYERMQRDVRVAAGVDPPRLELKPTEGLALRLWDEAGEPITSGFLHVSKLNGGLENLRDEPRFRADPDGVVRLASLPSGQFRIYAASPRSATVARIVEVPGPTVDLTLPRPGAIRARVRGVRWRTRVSLELQRDDGSLVSTFSSGSSPDRSWSGRSGTVWIRQIPPGNYRLVVQQRFDRDKRAVRFIAVTVNPGEVTDLTIAETE